MLNFLRRLRDRVLRREPKTTGVTMTFRGTLMSLDGEALGEVRDVTVTYFPEQIKPQTESDEIVAGLRSMGAEVRDEDETYRPVGRW